MSYFSQDAQTFLQDLYGNNDRAWFQANKSRFESALQAPALTFLEDANQWLEMAGLPYQGEPKKSGGGLSRIFRDSRFSEDKAPYHGHLVLHWRHAAGRKTKLMPVIGLRIAHDEVGIGAGIYGADTSDINRIRDHIVADGGAWTEAKEGLDLWGERLKTAPRGYDKDHPLIEDLRRKQFMATAPLATKQFTGDLMTAFQAQIMEMQPLIDFLADALE